VQNVEIFEVVHLSDPGVSVFTYVCVYVCMCACMHTFIYVRMHVVRYLYVCKLVQEIPSFQLKIWSPN